ncbi:carbon starvation CstA family protein, partial [Saccharopolyspora sp. NPDC002686]|uniref:carbon starvation CstA family protein n=1 Tax=Saccharopolyspora sp. NPDC002686 TaxID=3154541 RepID=UPI003319C4CD
MTAAGAPPVEADDKPRWTPVRIAIWVAISLIGAVAWSILALSRDEPVNAVWFVFAALASYAIAYRFYARFIVTKVLRADDKRATPAERLENGLDFQDEGGVLFTTDPLGTNKLSYHEERFAGEVF